MSSNEPISVSVTGAAGRMGQTLVSLTIEDDRLKLQGALEHPDSSAVGRSVSEVVGVDSDLTITDGVEPIFSESDVVIDFTRPEATEEFLRTAQKTETRLVIGTTGLDDQQEFLLQDVADNVAVVKAPNMSVGVNLLADLVGEATEVLGEGFDAEIMEMHHRHKEDAPSGTAMLLAEAIADVRDLDLDSAKQIGREGFIGERTRDEIGIVSLRGGDVVGDHTVTLAGEGERVELTHKASSRETFARGALRAVKFVKGKPDGLFSMKDVLGL
jgi:4-hydroxy-tetrahydrodipicolinate reductase